MRQVIRKLLFVTAAVLGSVPFCLVYAAFRAVDAILTDPVR